MPTQIWKKSKSKLIASFAVMLAGLIISSAYVNIADKELSKKVLAYVCVLVFVVAGIIFVRLLTSLFKRSLISHKLGVGRAAATQFVLRIIGYIILLLSALELMNISVAKLLLGGAILGIILGVAAQQSLGNFFASIILILTHPYRVGEEVTIISGSFGGANEGRVLDIGLTHTKLKLTNGKIMYMPNATILSWAAIIPDRSTKKH